MINFIACIDFKGLKEKNIYFASIKINTKKSSDFQLFQNLVSDFFCFFKYFSKQKTKNIFQKNLTLSNNNNLKKIILNHINVLLVEANNTFENNNFKAATIKYKEVLEIDKINKEAKDSLVKCYNSIGLIYNDKRDYHQAIAYFQKALKLGDLKRSQINLGHTYLILMNKTKALDLYLKSLAAFEDKKDFWKGMETDYEELNLANHGITQEYYNEILEKIKEKQ